MAVVTKMLPQGTPQTPLTTELNSYTFGNGVLAGSGVNNVVGTANWDGYPFAKVELKVAAVGTAVAASPALLWFLNSSDGGTNYESLTSIPSRLPDVVFYPQSTTSAQYVAGVAAAGPYKDTTKIQLPVGYFKCLFYWQGGGAGGLATLASSGNVVTVTPWTTEDV